MVLYDSPEYHDRLEQASSEGASRPLAFLESTGALLQNSVTLLAMGAILLRYSFWLPLMLLLSTLPALLAVLFFDRRYHAWWQKTTADRRWAAYYDIMQVRKYAAAEMRIFNLSRRFQGTYSRLIRRLRSERLRQLRKQSVAKLAANVIAFIVSGCAMAWVGWRALSGSFTFGDLALFYQALQRGQGLLRSLLNSVGQIYKSSLFLGSLFEFLNLKSSVRDPESPLPMPHALESGIGFNNVTFRYPGNVAPTLQNFSLWIPAGKIVAIVGENGAGKTTLFKLLCRFYDPESGNIELDGIDIRRFAVKDLWRFVTITFQRPLNYHALVRECIEMGDWASNPTGAEIEVAARNAGAHDFITRLPDGYDSLLGKGYADGLELSGGQWQRLALARAYLRQAPLILLDEPTSSMDSWSEVDWFERFRKLTEGRTAIVITHRFTIGMRADIIHVMREGQVVETGSHEELVARAGLYSQSWRAQVQATTANPRAEFATSSS
jgi:ATP-binding cassette subfamily B protein